MKENNRKTTDKFILRMKPTKQDREQIENARLKGEELEEAKNEAIKRYMK